MTNIYLAFYGLQNVSLFCHAIIADIISCCSSMKSNVLSYFSILLLLDGSESTFYRGKERCWEDEGPCDLRLLLNNGGDSNPHFETHTPVICPKAFLNTGYNQSYRKVWPVPWLTSHSLLFLSKFSRKNFTPWIGSSSVSYEWFSFLIWKSGMPCLYKTLEAATGVWESWFAVISPTLLPSHSLDENHQRVSCFSWNSLGKREPRLYLQAGKGTWVTQSCFKLWNWQTGWWTNREMALLVL